MTTDVIHPAEERVEQERAEWSTVSLCHTMPLTYAGGAGEPFNYYMVANGRMPEFALTTYKFFERIIKATFWRRV